MTVDQLLADLARRRVTLAVDGEHLRLSAPTGVLTGELRAAVAGHKAEIMERLRDRDAIPPAGRETPPLSFSQERLWLLHQFEPHSSAYNIPLAVTLRGPLNPAAVAQAVSEIARRHEVLRTTYPTRRGRPWQRIAPPAAVPLPLIDLAGLGGAVAAVALTAAEARRPFDLEAGPVLRGLLLRLAADEHRLLLTRHHIASDGWSLGLLAAELGELYRAFAGGRPSPLPALAIQYADFACLQRRQAGAGEPDERLASWLQRLLDAPPTLGLLAERRPATADAAAASVRRELSPAATRRLRALALEIGTTLFTVLLVAYGLVLASASGQHDLVLGTPVAGRGRRQLERLIGCFVNTLPLRLDLGGEPSFRAAAARAHGVVLHALMNQDVPLERLIEALRPERTVLGAPLFEAVLSFQNTPPASVRLPGLAATVEEPVTVAPKFPLALTAAERAGGLSLTLESDDCRLSPAAAEALLDRLLAVLDAAAADPDRSAAALLRLAAGPAAAPARPDGEEPRWCLHQLFERRAAAAPDAIAVSRGREHLSYGALRARARRLAGALAARGVGPETLVGLCAEPSPDLVVGVLGILLAGAAYVPLDPADPPRRLAAVLADAGVGALVTEHGLLGRLPAPGGPALPLDAPEGWDPAVPAGAGGPGPAAVVPDCLAYVIYTSGSTGAPKGVMVSHASVVRLFAAAAPGLGIDHRDVWTLAHSSAFDFSVWELFGALLHGGRLVVLPPATIRSPAELAEVVAEQRVSVLSQTPSAFRQLAPALLGAGLERISLRAVVLGGESCEPAQLAGWLRATGDGRPWLVNMYGITETTVHVTSRRLTAADLDGPSHSPVGRPLPGLRVQVVDRYGAPVPVGGQGELLVGGSGVARGYLGRPGLTAERFRPDDSPGANGRRVYASGDLARLLPGGELAYAGRLDQQVKLRGYRIEPGEVEAVLMGHPGVQAAAVTLRRDGGHAYLAAYVVPSGPQAPPEEELRRLAAERLPRHMVPAAVVALPRLPLTRNRKLDEAALPPPFPARPRPTEAPRTATERALAAIWRELLGHDSIGVHDDFFQLGADSLLITQFYARLPEVFGIELAMRRLYQALDIASVAEMVDRARAEAERDLHRLVEEVERLPEDELRRRLR